MPDGPPTSPLSPDHVLEWPGRTATADAVLAAVERRVQRRRQLRRRAAAAVASLALLIAAGTTWTSSKISSPHSRPMISDMTRSDSSARRPE